MMTPTIRMTLPTTKITLYSLLLLVLSTTTQCRVVETLFDTIVPTNCVTPTLQMAGFCALNNNCAERCFHRRTGDKPTPEPTPAPVDASTTASTFSLESDGLRNFYIPIEAIDCEQFEDPICPATECCPACREELNELYRCIILEGNHHYIDPLALNCPLDCRAPTVGGSQPTVPIPDPDPVDPVVGIDSNPTGIDSNMTDIEYDDEFFDDDSGEAATTEIIDVIANDLEMDVVVEQVPVDDIRVGEDEEATGEDDTTEIDIVENDLERDVVVIVSTSDGITIVDNHHNTTSVVTGRTSP